MKKSHLIIILFFIFFFSVAITFYLYSPNAAENLSFSTEKSILLGNDSYGSVEKMGPYGNTSSPVKIAYIIGVHPIESKSHQALLETISKSQNSLKYSYYLYKINVTKNPDNYAQGRMNGQLLASKYVVPDIKKEKFDLVIDIHSNVGNWDEKRFIFSPVQGSDSESIVRDIKNNLSWLKYYVPPNPTSTEYVTVPIIKSGIPAIIYETYTHEPYEVTLNHAQEFVRVVEGLSFNQ